MKLPKHQITLGITLVAFAIFAAPAYSQVSTFNGSVSNDYGTGGNWGPTSGVPNTAAGATAQIANGSAVTYNPGGDLVIANGGTLEITAGSFTQINGNNYIQLGQGGGNGNILVNGGTFNQGTDSATPFNITGTGNTFTISSGAANFNNTVSLNVGLTYLQAGGTITESSGEFDVNSNTASMTAGILNVPFLTTVNSGYTTTFDLSGGTVNFSNATGIYGGGANQVDFTTNSTGVINFLDTGTSSVQGMVNSGIISYQGLTDASAFTVLADGVNGATVELTAVPEPSTYALVGFGGLALGVYFVRRKKTAAAA